MNQGSDMCKFVMIYGKYIFDVWLIWNILNSQVSMFCVCIVHKERHIYLYPISVPGCSQRSSRSTILNRSPQRPYMSTSPNPSDLRSSGSPRSSRNRSRSPRPRRDRSRSPGGHRRGKKTRKKFTEEQLEALLKRFAENKYIEAPERIQLAKKIGLKDDQLTTWFQNQRMKKAKLLQQQQPGATATATAPPMVTGSPQAYQPAKIPHDPDQQAGAEAGCICGGACPGCK